MKNSTKKRILWTAALLPLGITAAILPFLPDEMPAHYNASGVIDRYGSKYEQLLLPVTIIGMTLFWSAIIRYLHRRSESTSDEKEKSNYTSNENFLYLVATGTALFFTAMHFYIMYTGVQAAYMELSAEAGDINAFVTVITGILMVFLGNYIPRTKPNSMVGLRTDATLSDENVWRKGNRFAGAAMAVSGIVSAASGIFIGGFASTMIMLTAIIITSVICTVYSYKIAK